MLRYHEDEPKQARVGTAITLSEIFLWRLQKATISYVFELADRSGISKVAYKRSSQTQISLCSLKDISRVEENLLFWWSTDSLLHLMPTCWVKVFPVLSNISSHTQQQCGRDVTLTSGILKRNFNLWNSTSSSPVNKIQSSPCGLTPTGALYDQWKSI